MTSGYEALRQARIEVESALNGIETSNVQPDCPAHRHIEAGVKALLRSEMAKLDVAVETQRDMRSVLVKEIARMVAAGIVGGGGVAAVLSLI